MFFAVIIRYRAPEEELAAHNAEHRAYMRTLFDAGKLVVSGPFVPRSGGLLLFAADSQAQVEGWLADDPFHRRDYYDHEILQWGPTLGKEGLATMVQERAS